jgi:N-glycosidase YbiA
MIAFKKVKEPFGWLGNMAAFPIVHEGKSWRTSEALFQALRFSDDESRELIREQKSPMSAKMISKSLADKRTIVPMSEADLDLMRLVLRLKVEQHPELKEQLLATGDEVLIEDVSARKNESGLFWGAGWKDGDWQGENWLGKLWVELRKSLRKE